MASANCDVETSTALLAAWAASSALVSAVPGGIHADRLVAPGTKPYARLECTLGKPPMVAGGTRYIDYRKVTITLWGVGKAAVGAIVDLIEAALAEQPLSGFPAGVAWIRTEALGTQIDEEEKIKAGEDYRAAKCMYMVWTDRRR